MLRRALMAALRALMLSDPTIADAICDRLVHNAHVLTLRGQSMRRKKGLAPNDSPATPTT